MRISERQFEPAWDHVITLRGIEVPLLSPRDAEADNSCSATRGARHALTRLGQRIRRWWVGELDTEWLAQQLAPLVPQEYRSLVAVLSGHELLKLRAVYMGLQGEFYAAIERASWGAQTAFTAEMTHGGRLQSKAGEPTRARAPEGRGQRFELVPGEPLPGIFGGGALWGSALQRKKDADQAMEALAIGTRDDGEEARV